MQHLARNRLPDLARCVRVLADHPQQGVRKSAGGEILHAVCITLSQLEQQRRYIHARGSQAAQEAMRGQDARLERSRARVACGKL